MYFKRVIIRNRLIDAASVTIIHHFSCETVGCCSPVNLMQFKSCSTFMNLTAPHPGVMWEASFIYQHEVQSNPCSIMEKPANIKLKFQKLEEKAPVLNINSIIHYSIYLSQDLKEPVFQFDWVCIQLNPLMSSDNSVTIFDSDKNFQFILRK